MRKAIILSIVLITITFTSCSGSIENTKTGNSSDWISDEETAVSISTNIDDIPDSNTLSEGEYFRIAHQNGEFFYVIYNESHEIVEKGNYNREPHITMVGDNLIRFTLQSGTGLSTQCGFYYDIRNNLLSQNFQCIYDQFNGKVVFGDVKKIIVQNIFDKTVYYEEISSFKQPFSDCVERIGDVKFIDNGTKLLVTYLSGKFREVTEIVDIN